MPPVDLSKPIVPQVMQMRRDEYLTWVDEHLPGSLTLFPYPFLETLSRTAWWIVPLVWLPISLALILLHPLSSPSTSSSDPPSWTLSSSLPFSDTAAHLLSGIAIWSFVEYVLHRFLFHCETRVPDSGVFLAVAFLLHGVHHLTPNDRHRLVFPPALGLVIGAALWAFFRTCVFTPSSTPLPSFALMFAGGILGYVAYDMVHYATHFLPFGSKVPLFSSIQRGHMRHHVVHTRGFGVTSPFWDYVFFTTISDKPVAGAGGRARGGAARVVGAAAAQESNAAEPLEGGGGVASGTKKKAA
jgi:sterol desaturase/sphingolipid hydroxylase (fatty acid hydroxylase superfamily)